MFVSTWNFLNVFLFVLIQVKAAQSCEITFRTFGDSHADIPTIEALKNIPDHLKHHFRTYSYSRHSRLMFSVARDGINMTELLKTPKSIFLRPWSPQERKIKLFNLTIPSVIAGHWAAPSAISQKDILYFVSGEIDARHKIGDVIKRGLLRIENLESFINEMVDRYIARIKEAVEEVPTKTVWLSGLHAQPLVTENINGWSAITGSWEERQLNIKLINQRLKFHCEKEGFVFMDFSEGYSNPNGDLNMEMTDGIHHLNLWTEKTKNEFAAKFVEHFERVCGQEKSSPSVQNVQATFEIDQSANVVPFEYEIDERPYLVFD